MASDNDVDSEGEAPLFDDSDFGSDGQGPTTGFLSRRRSTKRWSARPRRRRRPKGYSDDEELEDTDEDEEEEEMGKNIFECLSKHYETFHVNPFTCFTGELWINPCFKIECILDTLASSPFRT